MNNEIWFEVYIDYGDDEGTETVETFDSEQEAINYIEDNIMLDLGYDKWTTDDNGNNIKLD